MHGKICNEKLKITTTYIPLTSLENAISGYLRGPDISKFSVRSASTDGGAPLRQSFGQPPLTTPKFVFARRPPDKIRMLFLLSNNLLL